MMDLTPWNNILKEFKDGTPLSAKKEGALSYFNTAIKPSPEYQKLPQSEQNRELYELLKTLAPKKQITPKEAGVDVITGSIPTPAPPRETESLLKLGGKAAMTGALQIPKAIAAGGAIIRDKFGMEESTFAKTVQEAEQYWKTKPQTTLGRTVTGTGNTIGSMLTTIPLGGLVAMSTVSGINVAGEAYQEGAPLSKALLAGAVDTQVQYWTEKLPLHYLLKGGTNYIKRLGQGFLSDVPGEFLATLSEMYIEDTKILGKEYTPEQYTQALIDTFNVSGLTTFLSTSAIHPFIKEGTQEIDVKKLAIGIKKIINNESGTWGAPEYLNILRGLKEEEPLPQQVADKLIEENAFTLNVPILNALRNKGKLNPADLIRVPISNKDLKIKTKNLNFTLDSSIIDAFKTPEEQNKPNIMVVKWGKLSDFVDQPEVYKKMPWLKDINFELRSDLDAAGVFDGKTIFLNSKELIKNFKSYVLHEQQHAIEHKIFGAIFEGSTPERFPHAKAWSKTFLEMDKILQKDGLTKEDNARIEELMQIREHLQRLSMQQYRSVIGEMIARYNAETGSLSKEELISQQPLSSKTTKGIPKFKIRVRPPQSTRYNNQQEVKSIELPLQEGKELLNKMLEVLAESPEQLKVDIEFYKAHPGKDTIKLIMQDKIDNPINNAIAFSKKWNKLFELGKDNTNLADIYLKQAFKETQKAKTYMFALLKLKHPYITSLVHDQYLRLAEGTLNPEIRQIAKSVEETKIKAVKPMEDLTLEEIMQLPEIKYIAPTNPVLLEFIKEHQEKSKSAKEPIIPKDFTLTKMTPNEFLTLADKVMAQKYPGWKTQDIDRKSVDFYKEKIQKGEELEPIYIDMAGLAEGRHRATAYKELGIETVDVYVKKSVNTIIYNLTKENGGATINPRIGENLIGKEGYAVAVYPKQGKIVDKLTPEIIKDFISKNNSILIKDPQAMIGTWINEEKTYLDIVKVVSNQEEALKIGQQYKQKAIFDLQKLEEIPVPEKPIRGISTQRLLGQKTQKLTIEETKALKIKLRAEQKAAKEGYTTGKKEVKEKVKANLAEEELNQKLQYLFNINRGIAIPYQRLIHKLTKDISLKNFDRAAIQKTKDWFESVDPEEIGLLPATIEKIRKSFALLDIKMLSDFTLEEKQDIINTLKRLQAQGKLMHKIQLTLKEKNRKQLQDRLLRETVNLDGKASLGREAGKELYLNFLTPYRVADKMDGFKETGILKEFISQEAFAEISSDYNAGIQFTTFLNKALDIKVDWAEQELQRVVLVGLDIMEATTQRDILMEEMNLTEVPELTPDENALLLLTEQTMGQNKHGVASVFEAREGTIFPEIARYIFALKYPAQANVVDSTLMRQDYHNTKNVKDYFTEARKKGIKKLVRTDLFSMVKDSLFEQNWYMHMQPVLDTQASVLFTQAFKAKAGDINYSWWKDQIDITARRGYSSRAATLFSKTDQLLKQGRINLTQAVLAYKLSSALAQVFSTSDAMVLALTIHKPKIAAKILPNVLKAYTQKTRPAIYKLSKALQERTGGEQALEELFNKTDLGAFTRKGYNLLKEIDLRTAIGVQETFYNALQGKATNPLQQAEIYTLLSQAGGGIVFRPHILGTGEKAKTVLTLQTFFLNRWGLVAHDIIDKNIIHGNNKNKIYGAAALALLIATSLAEDEFREFLFGMLTKKPTPKEKELHKKIAGATLELIPILGRILSNLIQDKPQQVSEVPIIRITYKGIKAFKNIFTQEEYEAKFQGILASLETYITLRYGIAGTAQVFDLLDRFLPETKAQHKRRLKALKDEYKEAVKAKDKVKMQKIITEYRTLNKKK